jgi:hypothetical protein
MWPWIIAGALAGAVGGGSVGFIFWFAWALTFGR